MKKLFLSFALLAATALAAVSCSDDKTDPDVNVPATEVKVSPADPSIVVGTTVTLKAEVLPANATDKTIRWTSRDEAIASVKDGVVTGVSTGETQISAMCGKIVSSVKIIVTAAPIPVEAVTLNKNETEILEGKTETLTATVTPDDATDKTVTWDSDNKAVATVADGVITAIAEGTANITASAGEQSDVCVVTVKKPAAGDISEITLPYLSGLPGGSRTIKMTATGFAAGDKVLIADFFGYAGEAAVKNATAADAEFDMPAEAPLDRSYALTIMRDITEKQTATLRYDDQMVSFPFSLGYYFTGSNEVVADNGDMRGARRGYLPGKVFVLNTANNTFDAAKADLKLCTLNLTGGRLDLEYTTGLTSLDALKGNIDLTGVTTLAFANSQLESIDMTLFPEATELRAWGSPSEGYNGIKSISFGTYKTDPVCKLLYIQLERNQLAGAIDLRNCQWLKQLNLDDNQVTGLNLGIANTDQVLRLDEISAENNQIRELNIENCGRIRKLMLKGNPIERLTLLNNSKGTCLDGSASEKYMYIYKNQENFSLTWASASEAVGERHFNVEHYWWRVFSDANAGENTGKTEFEGGWVAGNPIVKALAGGVKVTCWTYHGEGGPDSHAMDGHVHEGGSAPCN